ncbi:MAG: RpiB/LacA/LacB family sugar-phosphate isomerase [bacterium]
MIYIASDHVGLKLKKKIASMLANELKVDFKDLGPKKLDPTDDFPDFAVPVGQKVVTNPKNIGILICASGHGMCIAANKIKGIRAIIGYSIEGARMGREHNNANILCLGAKALSQDHALLIVKKFLETKFDNDARLARRNKKIQKIEQL